MNVASFLAAPRAHAGRPLVFATAPDVFVPRGYHLTEVKRVAYSSMDCGGAQHAWTETHFELWAPPLVGRGFAAPMQAGKFLRIVDRATEALPLDGESEAKAFAGPAGATAALHRMTGVEPTADGRLVVHLAAERPRCEAAERRLAAAKGTVLGCCGIDGGAASDRAAKRSNSGNRAATACCG